MKKIKLIILSLLIFSLTNCTENDIVEENYTQEKLQINEVIEEILKMGYKVEEIIETDNFYLVQGDLMFSKNIENYVNINTQHRHAHTNDLVSTSNVTSMTVFVESSIPTSGSDAWRNAVISAIRDWNNISKCDVQFSYTTNSNADIDIRVKSDFGKLPDHTIASAGFPSGGQPYRTVLVNLDFLNNSSISESSKRYNMVHELGHCIGFRHTNWDINREGQAGVGANVIPDTPSQDPNSVMNGNTASLSWSGFSANDEIAARYLYPVASWAGPPLAYTRYPDPNICIDVFVQDDEYKLPISPGAKTYTLKSNSPFLWVNGRNSSGGTSTVQPNVTIDLNSNRVGNYTVTLTTSNQFGSKTATIYVNATNCSGTIGGGGF